MKILVLAEQYVKGNDYSLLYAHTRNLEYLKRGRSVVVLNFKEMNQYEVDGLEVFGEKELLNKFSLQDFDLVISHAPNLKNHFRFILKNLKSIKRLVLFIHGHEVLIKSKYYPEPFYYQKRRIAHKVVHDVYDHFKVLTWKLLLKFLVKKINLHLIFVSKWMEEEFYRCVRINRKVLVDRTSIVHNAVNPVFLEKQYIPQTPFRSDFVSIRPFDNPKYCVDLIWRLAKENPKYSFTLYGKGEFFDHYQKPTNLYVEETYLKHEEIPEVLNRHRAALMLTRLDAQGVMACEMAVYGIPLVTSDIPLKRDLLGKAENVVFMKNDLSTPLESLNLKTGNHEEIREKFSLSRTIQRELEIFNQLAQR